MGSTNQFKVDTSGNITGAGLTTTKIKDTGTNVGIGSAVPRALLEVGVGKLDVLTGGNVGVGSTLPSQALDVVGTVKASLGFMYYGNVGVSSTSPTGCPCRRWEGGGCTLLGTCS